MRAVNLLPVGDRRRRPVEVPSNASYIVLGVLAALLVAVVMVVLTQNQITSHRTDIARAQQETQAAQAKLTALGPFGQFAQVKQTRLQSVTDLSSARFDWERLMRELALVLPKDVWIIEANASASGAAEGGATTTAAGSSVTGPNVILVGCAPSQPAVAEVMVRLRNLHRAADVQLTESAEPDSGEDAATPNGCGASVQFNLTVSFSPAPAPDAQGENGDAVPTELGGGA